MGLPSVLMPKSWDASSFERMADKSAYSAQNLGSATAFSNKSGMHFRRTSEDTDMIPSTCNNAYTVPSCSDYTLSADRGAFLADGHSRCRESRDANYSTIRQTGTLNIGAGRILQRWWVLSMHQPQDAKRTEYAQNTCPMCIFSYRTLAASLCRDAHPATAPE